VFNIREGHGLGVFLNRVLRKISGPNSKKVTGDWRKLRNEEHDDLYSSLNMRHMWGEVHTRFLVGEAEKKKAPLARQRHKREDNIKMNQSYIWWEGVDWIHLVEDKNNW